MAVLWPLLLTAVLQAPEVEATTLDGQAVTGGLVSLDDRTAVVRVGDEPREIPLERLLSLQFSPSDRTPPRGHCQIIRLDGARLLGQSQSLRGATDRLTFTSPALGNVSLPLGSVANIRFQTADASLDDDWREMCARELRNDLLVIRKERDGKPFLDFVEGVVGEFDETELKLLLDGTAHELQRERVFGVIYYRRTAAAAGDAYAVRLATGESTPFRTITSRDGGFHVELPDGTAVEVAAEHIAHLDFSQGKVLYLSDAEPRDVQYTPYFDIIWEYRRDTNLDGDPLRLDGKTYRRGLCIHSRTLLQYRIGGDYRRLQATMGIDQNVAPLGHVHVKIQGDGRTLLETDVRGEDDPQPLDLDVTGIRDLLILVDFGEGLDIADHLCLAEARVIK